MRLPAVLVCTSSLAQAKPHLRVRAIGILLLAAAVLKGFVRLILALVLVYGRLLDCCGDMQKLQQVQRLGSFDLRTSAGSARGK